MNDMNGVLLRLAVVVGLVVSAAGAATVPAAAESATTGVSDTDESALDTGRVSAIDPERVAAEPDAERGGSAALDGRSVTAQVDVEGPQTSDEFLAAFRELSGQGSLETYSEFEVIRTQAVVSVQAGDFEDADRQRMRAVLRTLVRFDEAYQAAEEGDLSGSLQSAETTRESLSELESAGGTQYSSLAGVALDRFFRSLGDRFEERSREDISTPARIDALERAGEAYRAGGSSDRFAEVSVRAEQLASAYERDREEMNESIAAAQAFLGQCGDTCAGAVSAVTTHSTGVFGLYSDARAASAAGSEAVRIAETHNLERTEELQSLADESSSTLLSLAIGSALLLLAYAALLAVPTMLIAGRISLWAKDRRAASVGSILTPMPTEVRADVE
ncbi:hypothetical protein [Halobellus sp. GM3]|uniref:hypothetical protein n=1 Tax=Halobellus sp. GM3 TaxID=3458410 RepID=UPI00403D9FD3